MADGLLHRQILKLLAGKLVIGHAVHNDFKVLGYSHPPALTRDTSRVPLLNAKAGLAVSECASLKRLTKAIFNRDIQVGANAAGGIQRGPVSSPSPPVSSGWEEGPLLRGRRQSDDGALQSGGGGVGEAAGLHSPKPEMKKGGGLR